MGLDPHRKSHILLEVNAISRGYSTVIHIIDGIPMNVHEMSVVLTAKDIKEDLELDQIFFPWG